MHCRGPTPASAPSGYLIASAASLRNPLVSSKHRWAAGGKTRAKDAAGHAAVSLLAPGARIHGASVSRSTGDGHLGHEGASTPPVIDLVRYFKTVLDS